MHFRLIANARALRAACTHREIGIRALLSFASYQHRSSLSSNHLQSYAAQEQGVLFISLLAYRRIDRIWFLTIQIRQLFSFAFRRKSMSTCQAQRDWDMEAGGEE